MDTSTRRGFPRSALVSRYQSPILKEDAWHSYSAAQTAKILARVLSPVVTDNAWLLNAGAGTYRVAATNWREISLDLFAAPIKGGAYAVCGSVESLPFPDRTFGAAVCVGEVLGYCDPPKALSELSRTMMPGATLICDFRNSHGFRHLFTGA